MDRFDLRPEMSLKFRVSDQVSCLNKPQEFDQVTSPLPYQPHTIIEGTEAEVLGTE